jgi:hypothetical protein
MIKKSMKLALVVGVMVASMSMTSQTAQAGAPGEGAYLGAFVGWGSGIVQPKVVTSSTINSGTFESKEGGLGFSGLDGGGWLGYGIKMGDLYFGIEADGAGSGAEFELTSSIAVETSKNTTITSVTAQRNWQAGSAFRVGYYINADTLFSMKGGISVSEFDVTIGGDSDTYLAGGPQYGASVESKLSGIDPNLSLRMEFVYTDYLTASISGIGTRHQGIATADGHDSEITGSDSTGRLGLTYSF